MMKEAIAEARKRINEANAIITLNEQFIIIYQKICDHEWADSHTNGHTGVDYYKCDICGLIR